MALFSSSTTCCSMPSVPNVSTSRDDLDHHSPQAGSKCLSSEVEFLKKLEGHILKFSLSFTPLTSS